ncbi:hypothetical protein CFC21_001643 [Triticum aestivum]|uniref:Uncharacterized protein n=1 Tax=Triticum aestivum TaxID=4565 RepID=A0A3B6QBI6_WHEAT|nr:hypothetical protein CFC21_001643 [Triticum aestivum]
MAGNEGSTTKRLLGRCTAEESPSKPTQQKSAIDGFGTPERCTTEYPFMRRKAKEADQDQDEEQEKEKEIDGILATGKLPRHADVVSVAAADPMVAEQDISKATVSEPQAEAEIEEPVPEPQAEDQDVYDDEDADYDYQDEYDGYYDEDEDEDDYESEYEDDDDDDYDWESEFAKHRTVVRETLLSFPEAANLEPTELDAAVERVLEQSKPEYQDVADPGKIRLLKDDISLVLAQERLPPITHDLPSTIYPADMIQKSKELDKELLPVYKKAEDRFEKFQAKVRKDLIEKGYAEVDEDYYDNRDRFWEEIEEEWKKIDFSRFRIASSADGIIRYSGGRGDYKR